MKLYFFRLLLVFGAMGLAHALYFALGFAPTSLSICEALNTNCGTTPYWLVTQSLISLGMIVVGWKMMKKKTPEES